jgi:hypothetical protein
VPILLASADPFIASRSIVVPATLEATYRTNCVVPNRAGVDRLGVSEKGVTFVRRGTDISIPWRELIPSKMQFGKGFLVLRTAAGTPSRGGPWVVDAAQGSAILLHPRWPDPDYANRVVPEWLNDSSR